MNTGAVAGTNLTENIKTKEISQHQKEERGVIQAHLNLKLVKKTKGIPTPEEVSSEDDDSPQPKKV